MKKKVFYFNINYACNNKCLFCYSHNTMYASNSPKELSFDEFKRYIELNAVTSSDRIVLNGGEPIIHSEINKIIDYLGQLNCETVIFTNGRMIRHLVSSVLNRNVRFVIPVHGCEGVHDYITGIVGSYRETLQSMLWLKENGNGCLVDMKIILNNETIKSNELFAQSVNAWSKIPFNNSLHITMMADTIVSKSNGCPSLDLEHVSYFTFELLKLFNEKCSVKIYDTCIKSIIWLSGTTFKKYDQEIEFHYKDFTSDRMVKLYRPNIGCIAGCEFGDYCLSAVTEYKVLEFSNNQIYESVE